MQHSLEQWIEHIQSALLCDSSTFKLNRVPHLIHAICTYATAELQDFDHWFSHSKMQICIEDQFKLDSASVVCHWTRSNQEASLIALKVDVLLDVLGVTFATSMRMFMEQISSRFPAIIASNLLSDTIEACRSDRAQLRDRQCQINNAIRSIMRFFPDLADTDMDCVQADSMIQSIIQPLLDKRREDTESFYESSDSSPLSTDRKEDVQLICSDCQTDLHISDFGVHCCISEVRQKMQRDNRQLQNELAQVQGDLKQVQNTMQRENRQLQTELAQVQGDLKQVQNTMQRDDCQLQTELTQVKRELRTELAQEVRQLRQRECTIL